MEVGRSDDSGISGVSLKPVADRRVRSLRRRLGMTLYGFALTAIGFLVFLNDAWASSRPSFVIVQVDDMATKLLKPTLADGKRSMPALDRLLVNRGTYFTNYYKSTPLCSPSRSALLSGQFGHNSGIVANQGPFGGWTGWLNRESILENNLVTLLQDSGYHTAHFGKWMNSYPGSKNLNPTVPPGWNTWVSDASDDSTLRSYGYRQLVKIHREDGPPAIEGPFGNPEYGKRFRVDPAACSVGLSETDGGTPCFYHSDRMSRLAAEEIRATEGPLFLQVDYHSPHADRRKPVGPQPATRHLGLARRVILPRSPAFNERNTTDKAFVVQRDNGPLRRRNARRIQRYFRASLESLRSVDEGISYLIEALKETDRLSNTYFIFLSDNGYFHGEHRFASDKLLAYEGSANVPLIIRGPGVLRGRTNTPASTVDLTPTILDASAIPLEFEMDGTSLLPTLEGRGSAGTRRGLLVERIAPVEMEGGTVPKAERTALDPNRPVGRAPNLMYRALRIGRYKLISYSEGGRELYDLKRDPNELYNQIRNPGFADLLDYMEDELVLHSTCRGAGCIREPGVPPPTGTLRLDATRPPKRFRPSVAYLWRDAVHTVVECNFGRPCATRVAISYRGKRVTKRVTFRSNPGDRRRVRVPAIRLGRVDLQEASERRSRIEVEQEVRSAGGSREVLITRPRLLQNNR